MEQETNTATWIKALTLLFLAGLLSACYDLHNGSGSKSSNTTVGVINDGTGTDAGDHPAPAEGTDTAAADPYETWPDEPASADPQPVLIALSWQPTPGQIDGYLVHTGPSPELATSVISVTSATSVEFDAVTDLGLNPGDQSCFRIKAYNSEGQSGFSEAVCYTVQRMT